MNEKPRQRRPAFDREQGIAIAQALFHQRGFDAVSLADLTEAMNIKPPSFYAAYGSKAELFERAMHRYAGENALPMDKLLAPDRPPAEALTALLVAAAKQYGRDSALRGCLITEGMRADDPIARNMAEKLGDTGIQTIRRYLDEVRPDAAQALADYLLVTLRGLSAAACSGMPCERLVEVAQTAGKLISREFEASDRAANC
ncbi:TetR/AcrR family transcriptional regulator [Pseudomonas sp. B21-036]|jgi:TetR/AcrR family transcriptional regulator, repressor for divergent bdcA|uniref:TetR/AcrR family transcriptional regulator n=1 Tax=Pseudomonas TaxID=286 RepID=UPI0021608BC5|nr:MULTISPECIES: TetR/AcrR family transcriptional regulator [Pseudomonas]MDD2068502.1 TetR/AcrR family transcriptional regulator [Pseudomonas putida]UVL53617.1 TetR/AcrR family transcriptional regulator [Pseudomonas sp. B21-036]HDS1739679.1 TetR/AcrR family transcriptional regulator [Pseudomonas putida]